MNLYIVEKIRYRVILSAQLDEKCVGMYNKKAATPYMAVL